jgi:serine/threonine protein kinase
VVDEVLPGALTEDLPAGLLRPGRVLGDRYRIGSQLGRGGMGEVWRAFDLKLSVDVALKALREELLRDEQRRELLRSEVRAAREVVSPNVCRVFDLIEADGRELVAFHMTERPFPTAWRLLALIVASMVCCAVFLQRTRGAASP